MNQSLMSENKHGGNENERERKREREREEEKKQEGRKRCNEMKRLTQIQALESDRLGNIHPTTQSINQSTKPNQPNQPTQSHKPSQPLQPATHPTSPPNHSFHVKSKPNRKSIHPSIHPSYLTHHSHFRVQTSSKLFNRPPDDESWKAEYVGWGEGGW